MSRVLTGLSRNGAGGFGAIGRRTGWMRRKLLHPKAKRKIRGAPGDGFAAIPAQRPSSRFSRNGNGVDQEGDRIGIRIGIGIRIRRIGIGIRIRRIGIGDQDQDQDRDQDRGSGSRIGIRIRIRIRIRIGIRIGIGRSEARRDASARGSIPSFRSDLNPRLIPDPRSPILVPIPRSSRGAEARSTSPIVRHPISSDIGQRPTPIVVQRRPSSERSESRSRSDADRRAKGRADAGGPPLRCVTEVSGRG